MLPDGTPVFPTHGFGSFCSATPSARTVVDHRPRSAGAIRRSPRTRTTFVAELLDGLDAYPAYYAHMAPLNAAGPAAGRPGPAGARSTPPSCARASGPASGWSTCGAGRRSRRVTWPGPLNLGLDGAFLTYLGWLIPWGTPVSLVADTARGRR